MITNRDVNNLLSFIPNVVGKAYVTHIFSSGMTKKEALNLCISDLIEACDSAFGFTEERTLENLLVKKPEIITPMWIITKKRGNVKITFSSGESLFYLFIYLTERLVKNGRIGLDEKLFVTGSSVLSSKELNDIFKHSKKRYVNYISYSLKYRLETFDFSNYNYSSRDLRDNFKYVSEKVLDNSIDDKKEGKKLHKLFTEGLSEKDKYFGKFSNDTSKLKGIYLNIVQYLTAKNYGCKYPDYFYERTFDKKIYSEEIVIQILKDYMNFFRGIENLNDYRDGEEFFEIFKDLALFDNEHGFFKESKEYLTILLAKTTLKQDILSCDFEFNEDNSIDDVVNYVEELGIFDKYKIKKEMFKLSIEDYFSALDMNKIKRNLSKSDLADLLIESNNFHIFAHTIRQ